MPIPKQNTEPANVHSLDNGVHQLALETLQKNLNGNDAVVRSYEGLLKQQELRIQVKNDEISTLSRQLSDLRSSHSAQIDSIRSENRAAIDALKDEIRDLKDENRELKFQVNNKTSRLDRILDDLPEYIPVIQSMLAGSPPQKPAQNQIQRENTPEEPKNEQPTQMSMEQILTGLLNVAAAYVAGDSTLEICQSQTNQIVKEAQNHGFKLDQEAYTSLSVSLLNFAEQNGLDNTRIADVVEIYVGENKQLATAFKEVPTPALLMLIPGVGNLQKTVKNRLKAVIDILKSRI